MHSDLMNLQSNVFAIIDFVCTDKMPQRSSLALSLSLNSQLPFQSSSQAKGAERDMKVPPIQLPNGMDRLPLPLPFSPDLLWRYPNPFLAQPPPSPLESHVKSGLPGESSVCYRN